MYNYIFMKNIPIIIFPIIQMYSHLLWLVNSTCLVTILSHLSASNLIPLTYIPHDVHFSINFFIVNIKIKIRE